MTMLHVYPTLCHNEVCCKGTAWYMHCYLLRHIMAPTFILCSYFVCMCSESSGQPAQMRKLTLALVAGRCDKYQNLMNWPIIS